MKKIIILFTILSFSVNAQQLAFPDAYGAAAYMNPSRGGSVIHITSLNDSDSDEIGTLRWAIKNPTNKVLDRIVVFDVSGLIDLQSRLYASNNPGDEGGYTGTLYIAGQTAPEGGITITGDNITLSGFNTIVRYIKFRHQESHSGSDTTISLGRADNHIIDHCSFSHHSPSKSTVSIATKNNSDVEDFTNGTFSNNLLGNNTLGFIAGESTPSSPDTNGYFTVIRNGYYNISHRVPLKGGSAIKVDVVNNIVHNWSARTIRMDGWEYKLNHFENYYQAGTNTSNQLKWTSYLSNTGNPQIYTTDNFLEDDPRGNYSKPAGFDTDESVAWTQFQDNFVPLPSSYFTDVQHSINGRAFTIYQNAQLKDSILPEIGACKYMDNNGNAVFSRDVYDEEYVNGIISNSDSTRDTNLVLPIQTSSNTRPGNFYVSNDHIPEVWFSANVPDGEDHNDTAPSGYTWLEEYMNQVDGDVVIEDVDVTGVTITATTYEIGINQKSTFSKTVAPINATNKTGVWSSSNGSVATINQQGVATGLTEGSASITFTTNDGTFTDTKVLQVTEEIAPILNGGTISSKKKLLINN